MSHILNLLKKSQEENASKMLAITNNISDITASEPHLLANFLLVNNTKLLKYSVYSEILTTLIHAHEKNIAADGVEKAEEAFIKYSLNPIKQKTGYLKSTDQVSSLINETKINFHLYLQEMAQIKFMIYRIALLP